jgi:hypothetical protein
MPSPRDIVTKEVYLGEETFLVARGTEPERTAISVWQHQSGDGIQTSWEVEWRPGQAVEPGSAVAYALQQADARIPPGGGTGDVLTCRPTEGPQPCSALSNDSVGLVLEWLLITVLIERRLRMSELSDAMFRATQDGGRPWSYRSLAALHDWAMATLVPSRPGMPAGTALVSVLDDLVGRRGAGFDAAQPLRFVPT